MAVRRLGPADRHGFWGCSCPPCRSGPRPGGCPDPQARQVSPSWPDAHRPLGRRLARLRRAPGPHDLAQSRCSGTAPEKREGPGLEGSPPAGGTRLQLPSAAPAPSHLAAWRKWLGPCRPAPCPGPRCQLRRVGTPRPARVPRSSGQYSRPQDTRVGLTPPQPEFPPAGTGRKSPAPQEGGGLRGGQLSARVTVSLTRVRTRVEMVPAGPGWTAESLPGAFQAALNRPCGAVAAASAPPRRTGSAVPAPHVLG